MVHDQVNFDNIPKANEQSFSVTSGCIKFIDSYQFLSSSLEELVNNLDEDDFNFLKREFPDHSENLNEKLAYPYDCFNKIED